MKKLCRIEKEMSLAIFGTSGPKTTDSLNLIPNLYAQQNHWLPQNQLLANQYFMPMVFLNLWLFPSVGVVEALKDQGLCRWNNALRSVQHQVKNNVRSLSQAKNLSSSSSAMVSGRLKEEGRKQSEESLRTVMYLSCWGPN
ncbi:uncharacterized protein HKW66_Vig0218540 [Vigna angularis]|uniref:Uncharacterized protein n=1 Tax=Phaseolus angularis TaxID=3914 RepID=A0A8T0JHM7_PHAAN|nr:uncharacterized protein HKW66_Vig0218540 [Vigna angularis]